MLRINLFSQLLNCVFVWNVSNHQSCSEVENWGFWVDQKRWLRGRIGKGGVRGRLMTRCRLIGVVDIGSEGLILPIRVRSYGTGMAFWMRKRKNVIEGLVFILFNHVMSITRFHFPISPLTFQPLFLNLLQNRVRVFSNYVRRTWFSFWDFRSIHNFFLQRRIFLQTRISFGLRFLPHFIHVGLSLSHKAGNAIRRYLKLHHELRGFFFLFWFASGFNLS